jgi:hypothetical protein
MASANKNNHIVFCSVNVDECREAASVKTSQSIPEFHFYLNGTRFSHLIGADPNKFKQSLDALNKQTSSKALEHQLMDFK